MASPLVFRPKCVVVYRISKDIDLSNLAEQLKEFTYAPCGPQDLSRSGWIEPLGDLSKELSFQSNGLILLAIKKEQKILPPGTIKELVSQRQSKLEKEQGRLLKRAEIDSLKDVVTQELLPKALSNYGVTMLWIDPKSRLFMVDASSHKKAEAAAALLRKTIGSFPIIPFTLETPIELTLTNWVKTGSLPAGLALCNEATLKAMLEDGGTVTAKNQDLITNEIANHIQAGKLVTKVSMSWVEAMSFVINDSFILSRIQFSDALSEQNDDISTEEPLARFDADFVLFSQTIMEVIDQMIAALGGEAKELPAPNDGEKNKGKVDAAETVLVDTSANTVSYSEAAN